MSEGAGVSGTQITAQGQPVAMDSELSSLSQLTANIKAADKLSSVLDSTGVRSVSTKHKRLVVCDGYG